MPDAASRKGLTASPSQNNVSANKKAAKATGEEATIKVASKKEPRTPANGPAKLKRPIPKLNGIGNWRDATIVNGWCLPLDFLSWAPPSMDWTE